MTDRPILFSGPMVRALLDGRKTQTRRVVKLPIPDDAGEVFYWSGEQYRSQGAANVAETGLWARRNAGPEGWLRFLGPCPYGVPGDRLWVREAWTKVPATAYRMSEGVQQTVDPGDPDMAAIYAAGWDRSIPKWRPSIHMPRWASRITLQITDVRVERLQAISEADARAEGIAEIAPRSKDGMRHFGVDDTGHDRSPIFQPTAVRAYRFLWEQINGPGSWDANPWVWAITFDVQGAP